MKPAIVIIENNLLSTLSMRERLTAELMRHYDVTVLSTGSDLQKKEAREKGFNVVEIGSSNHNIFHILKYFFTLRRELRNINPEVCLTFTIRPAIWGNLAARSLRIPVITTITGIGPLFSPQFFVYRAARWLYKFALSKTKKIFFQNQDDRNLFIQKGYVKPGNCLQIPGSGVDPDFFKPALSPVSPKFTFLFIGRLVKDKGIREFVTASRLLKNHSIDAECQILGPYWSQNLPVNTVTAEEMDKWVKSGDVKYLGEASDVRPFIAAANCVVLPSYREGLNNVLLEASAMERPCITTDTTGCREIIEDGVNGFLCEPQSAESLAEKMESMYKLSSETRMEMGRKGRRKVIREFDKKIVIEAYMSAIAEIISSREPASM